MIFDMGGHSIACAKPFIPQTTHIAGTPGQWGRTRLQAAERSSPPVMSQCGFTWSPMAPLTVCPIPYVKKRHVGTKAIAESGKPVASVMATSATEKSLRVR